MKGDKAVFDVEIRWASNAEIVLEAGVKPIPLMITLDKIRFSGKMRIELAPLVPVVSCTRSCFVYVRMPSNCVCCSRSCAVLAGWWCVSPLYFFSKLQ